MQDNGEPKRVLEIGSGPVPIHLISASRWSNDIVSSDFLEQNRLKFTQWLSAESKEEDNRWLAYARYVAGLENDGYYKRREVMKIIIILSVIQLTELIRTTQTRAINLL